MMKRAQRTAVIGALCDKLREHGSWSGETHVQKCAYVAQELLGVDLGFEFVLYKHGPFSFELRDELSRLRGTGLLALEPRYPYGPGIYTTEAMREREERFPKTLAASERALEFVASELGPMTVAELERVATALYVYKELPDASAEERAAHLVELKPHVSEPDALEAVQRLDQMRAKLSDAA